MQRKHYQFGRNEGAAAFIERHITWKLENQGGCGPAGFDCGLDQPTTDRIVAMLEPLLQGIAAAGQITPAWTPANDFQVRRLAKAYTDRGLRAA